MSKQPNQQATESIEGFDLDKLWVLLKKNAPIIVLLFLSTNLISYLTIRWTKDEFESYSELKLEVKQDATALGIKQFAEDQNRNLVAGEIEQMRSKLFFSRVLDSLDLWISYYSVGNVLEHEMYHRSPFQVRCIGKSEAYLDQPIFVDFLENNKYQLWVGENGAKQTGVLGESVALKDADFVIELTPNATPDFKNHFFFVMNSRDRLLDFLSSNLRIEPINFDANTIRVTFRDFNPLKVYTVVNKIDSVYLYYSNEQKNRANKQKIDWLNQELRQVENKMEGFENYFEDFTLKNKSSDLTTELRQTIYALNQVDSQRFSLNKRILELNGFMDELAKGKSAQVTPKNFLPDYLNARIEEYQKLVQAKERLTLSYKDNTFAYQQKDQELNATRTTLFTQLSEIKKQWLNAMVDLNQKKESLEKKFAGMPDKSTQYSKNQRFYKLYEEFYLSMMQAKAEFEIAQAGSTPDLKILSSAVLPNRPVAPNRYLILGIGFVAGLVLNFFFISIVYLLSNKITSLQEIERTTNVPVLGVIPEMRRNSASPFYIVENPRSIVSEAIRTLRTNLDFFTASETNKIIVISSTVSGEGKSFLAMNLGGILAMSNRKVILLDLDMRKAKEILHARVNDPSKGISTLLIHKTSLEESITKTDMAGFDYIPSGPHPPNPSELLLSKAFEDLLTELRTRYDYIVIDTPPVGLVTDGIMAMKRADLSIYVVRANYSRKEFLSNLDRIVGINKLSHVAVVLNALPTSGKTYGYGYYHEDQKKRSLISKIFRS